MPPVCPANPLPINFNRIQEDEDAQAVLRQWQKEGKTPEQIFELIYRNQVECGEEAMEQKKAANDIRQQRGEKPFTSALGQEYYDERAKAATQQAMHWLDQTAAKKPKFSDK